MDPEEEGQLSEAPSADDFASWITTDPLASNPQGGDEPKPAQNGAKPSASQPAQPSAAQPEGQAAQQQGTQNAPVPPQPNDELSKLRQQVARLEGIAQTVQRPQQQPQGKSAEQQQVQQEAFRFGVELPQNVWAALDSEDVNVRRGAFTQVMNAFASMAAQQAYQRALQDVEPRLRQVYTEIPQYMSQQQQVQQQMRAVYDDFYKSFPALANPALQQMVRSVAGQVMQETGQTSWSPQLRDAVGQRAMQVLQQATGSAPQQQAPQQAPRPAQISRNGTSARPAPAPSNEDPVSLFFGLTPQTSH